MGTVPSSLLYEPESRFAPFSNAVGGEIYMWGGRTLNFNRKSSDFPVQVYNPVMEVWRQAIVTGECPLTLYRGTSTNFGHYIYTYGGFDGTSRFGSLHMLDTQSFRWRQLAQHSSGGPMLKSSCGIVCYKNHLILFGGFGQPNHPIQPGSECVRRGNSGSWTNELHSFDLIKGEGIMQWSNGCYLALVVAVGTVVLCLLCDDGIFVLAVCVCYVCVCVMCVSVCLCVCHMCVLRVCVTYVCHVCACMCVLHACVCVHTCVLCNVCVSVCVVSKCAMSVCVSVCVVYNLDPVMIHRLSSTYVHWDLGGFLVGHY